MKKAWKKAVSSLLTLAMVLSVAPVTVFAENEGEPVVQAAVEVGTYDELVEAIANGGEITITKDITLDEMFKIEK